MVFFVTFETHLYKKINDSHMKRFLRRLLVLASVAVLVPSCEFLEDCKSCTLVTESGSGTSYGSTATYCGTQLAEKEAENVTINGTTTYYDCE